MTYHSNLEGGRKYRLPIYYLEVKLSYIKRKTWTAIDTWIITTIEDENYILREDPKTKDYLFQSIYGKGYKSTKAIRLDKVYSKKQIGHSNRFYNELSETQKKIYEPK